MDPGSVTLVLLIHYTIIVFIHFYLAFIFMFLVYSLILSFSNCIIL